MILERFLRLKGQSVTLSRTGQVDLNIMAIVRGYQPHELIGDIQQGDRLVIISNVKIAASGWPGPPRKSDKIVIRGKTFTIQSVDSVSVGDEIIRHNIQARG